MAEIENLKIGSGGTIHIVGNEDIVAEAWAAGQSYVKDKSYVINNHVLYVCNTSHTSVSPFDPTNWTQITVGESLGDMLSAIPESASDLPYAAGVSTADAIGVLSSLDTSTQTSLVAAINDVIATSKLNPVYGNTSSGSIATFDTSLALPLQDCTIAINAVQESGTPTPSSPKAISGFTGANIKVVGTNLIDFLSDLKSSSNGLSISIDNGGIKFVNQPTASWADLSNIINVFLPKGTYTFSRTTSATYNVYIDVIFEDSTTATMSITSGTTSRTATYNKNIVGVKLHLSGLSTSTTYSETIYLQFEKGSTASTTYNPYNPNSTTTAISWQDEAGTVYGGSLDVTSGKLTVTHKGLSINSSSNFVSFSVGTANANATFNLTDAAIETSGVGSKKGAISSTGQENPLYWSADRKNETPDKGNMSFAINGSGTVIRFYITENFANISTIDDFKNAFTATTLVYPLKTPVSYQLTPTQISAIVGTNNVFTDTNGDTSVVYACSLKDYIDGQ